jgi:hypothetical protein
MLQEILTKYGYVPLTAKESKMSRGATHQRSDMRDEAFALTLIVDGDSWIHHDHRGYESGRGNGADSLDRELALFLDE